MELKKYKLGEILDVTRGASLSGEFYATEGKCIRLTCGNFDYQNNCFKENKSKDNLYYIGDFKPEFLMEEGDIITPLTEQAIGLLGSTAIIPESGKYIQSQDVAKIICKEELLDKDFAFYLISSTLVKQQLSAAAQQTKIRHTSPDKIRDCTVWIPELTEQKRIGKLLRSLDRKIELNRSVNQKLEATGYGWIKESDVPKSHSTIPLHKIYIPKSGGSGTDAIVLGSPFYGEPNSVCSYTYLVIGYNAETHNFSQEECYNIIRYIKSRFFRYMVSIKKKTQDNPRDVFQFVPLQDFSKPWTDKELYGKYELDLFEREYIESLIKPME